MSKKEDKKITCPKCMKQQTIHVHSAVNVTAEPTLREEVLSGDIFKRTCKHCGATFILKYPLLYNDIENRFLIYYIPDIENSKIIDNSLENEFTGLDDITRRIVPDFESFKEKIAILESGLDDMAIEITKLAVTGVVKEKIDSKIKNINFSFCHREKNTIGFIFETDAEPYCQSTRLEIYDKAVYIVKKTAGLDKNMTGFLKVDKEWADNMLYRFRLREQKRMKLQETEKYEALDAQAEDAVEAEE